MRGERVREDKRNSAGEGAYNACRSSAGVWEGETGGRADIPDERGGQGSAVGCGGGRQDAYKDWRYESEEGETSIVSLVSSARWPSRCFLYMIIPGFLVSVYSLSLPNIKMSQASHTLQTI